jgi:hypothetical protein
MVHNTQNYWVFGFSPSNWICFRPQMSTLQGPSERANLKYWTTRVSQYNYSYTE